MPFVPAPAGTVRVRITWGLGSSVGQNVFHVAKIPGTSPSGSDLDDIIQQVIHAYSPGDDLGPLELLSNACVMSAIDVISLEDETAPGATLAVNLPGHKTTSGVSAPPGVAVVVAMQTGHRGKSFRGRLYQMGIPASDVDSGGSLLSTPHTAWQQRWTSWLGGLTDGSNIEIVPVVASFFHGVDPVTKEPIPRVLALTNVINAVTVRPSVHSQRRRYQ